MNDPVLEPPVQKDYGLLRQGDFPGKGTWSREFEEWARKFHYPSITDARLLFTPKYAWSFWDKLQRCPWNTLPTQAITHDAHPLAVFQPNAALPRGTVGGLVYAHWETFQPRGVDPGGTGLCYAVEPVSLSEGQCAELGMRWSSILTETGRCGCDNGWFDHVKLINWSEGRTLVVIGSGGGTIATPWVTLVDTAKLVTLMGEAERLDWRPM